MGTRELDLYVQRPGLMLRHMVVIHLTASRFFGGPERQMLELARSLSAECQTAFVSLAESGLRGAFLDQVRDSRFRGVALRHDTPRLVAAFKGLVRLLRDWMEQAQTATGRR